MICINIPLSSSCFHQWDRIGDSGPSDYDANRVQHHDLGRVPVFLCPQPGPFTLCYYSLLFGAGVGIAYEDSVANGWKLFPDKKGIVNGAVVAGFDSSSFVLNQAR